MCSDVFPVCIPNAININGETIHTKLTEVLGNFEAYQKGVLVAEKCSSELSESAKEKFNQQRGWMDGVFSAKTCPCSTPGLAQQMAASWHGSGCTGKEQGSLLPWESAEQRAPRDSTDIRHSSGALDPGVGVTALADGSFIGIFQNVTPASSSQHAHWVR